MNLKSILNKIRFSQKRPHGNFNPDKKELIDYAFSSFYPTPASFADLGGIWNVDGVYTFYTLGKYKIKHAILADTDITYAAFQKSSLHDNLRLIHGNFGERLIAEQIGKVDIIFLFDVLLHQVDPGWDQILEMYSPGTDYFVIYNQQWIGAESSVRLLDLGKDEYFRNVPHSKEEPLYKNLFDKMNEIHPEHNKIWRNIHNVWQWGITDHDLTGKMENLGFKMQWYRNYGRFGSLTNFENHGFIFQRK